MQIFADSGVVAVVTVVTSFAECHPLWMTQISWYTKHRKMLKGIHVLLATTEFVWLQHRGFALPRAQGLNVRRCTQMGTGEQISPGRSQHHCLPWSVERPPGWPASSGLLMPCPFCMVNVGGFNMFVSLLEMMICKWYFRCMGVALDLNTNQTPQRGWHHSFHITSSRWS